MLCGLDELGERGACVSVCIGHVLVCADSEQTIKNKHKRRIQKGRFQFEMEFNTALLEELGVRLF